MADLCTVSNSLSYVAVSLLISSDPYTPFSPLPHSFDLRKYIWQVPHGMVKWWPCWLSDSGTFWMLTVQRWDNLNVWSSDVTMGSQPVWQKWQCDKTWVIACTCTLPKKGWVLWPGISGWAVLLNLVGPVSASHMLACWKEFDTFNKWSKKFMSKFLDQKHWNKVFEFFLSFLLLYHVICERVWQLWNSFLHRKPEREEFDSFPVANSGMKKTLGYFTELFWVPCYLNKAWTFISEFFEKINFNNWLTLHEFF